MLMKGNIYLVQKVNQGDKFKSFLCHYHRKVQQSLITLILQRMSPFLWMPSTLALLSGYRKILHDFYKGAILYPFLQHISIMA